MIASFVSIIVPTYQDWNRLALCIKALVAQSYPPELFEVLIVNNDPQQEPPGWLQLPKGFQLINEPKVGSYAARNAALKIAKGSIIGFTDSDCIPDPSWIENAIHHFRTHPECSRIAGHISIYYEKSKPTVAEVYNTVFSFPQQTHASRGTSVTGNLFAYKKVFDVVGLFNDNLLSLGDLDWGRKANSAGFKICYVPSVLIKHPARSLSDLIKKEKRVGGGQARLTEGTRVKQIMSCIKDMQPRPSLLKLIYKSTSGVSIPRQLRVFILRHYLVYIRTLEKYRVLQGRQPERA